jgi:hypothetical protein
MIGCRERGIQGVCIYRRDALMSLRFRTRYNADVIVMSTEVKDVVGFALLPAFLDRVLLRPAESAE